MKGYGKSGGGKMASHKRDTQAHSGGVTGGKQSVTAGPGKFASRVKGLKSGGKK